MTEDMLTENDIALLNDHTPSNIVDSKQSFSSIITKKNTFDCVGVKLLSILFFNMSVTSAAKNPEVPKCKWGSGLLKSRLCFLTSKNHKQDYKQRGTTTWG